VIHRFHISHIVLFIFSNLSSKETNKAVQQKTAELKTAVASTFAAVAIGSSVLANPLVADAAVDAQQAFPFSSSNVVAEKVVRQGLYSEYEVEINQEVDDARSTFKSAKETKSKKGEFGFFQHHYYSFTGFLLLLSETQHT
jgi:hypothetical protein